jgi:hypothetical protein
MGIMLLVITICAVWVSILSFQTMKMLGEAERIQAAQERAFPCE